MKKLRIVAFAFLALIFMATDSLWAFEKVSVAVEYHHSFNMFYRLNNKVEGPNLGRDGNTAYMSVLYNVSKPVSVGVGLAYANYDGAKFLPVFLSAQARPMCCKNSPFFVYGDLGYSFLNSGYDSVKGMMLRWELAILSGLAGFWG